VAYAENTEVSVDKSIGEIIALIRKAGADRIAQMQEPGRIAMQFFLKDRLLRFTIALPSLQDGPQVDRHGYGLSTDQKLKKQQQRHRQRARALLLVIKAKLESVESNVETFEEAFLANIVTPGGATVADWLIPQIEEGYRIGKMPTQLLLADSREDA
jgi:hypothetical protein